MANLNPTLIIGLGSTGLQIIEFYRQLLLEEFGTTDVPIIRCIAFETNQSETSDTGLKIHGLTVDSVPAVRSRIDKYPEHPAVQGYKNWLPNYVTNKGDSFRAGAGGIRAAGRLILWENWDQVKQIILSNYKQATSISSRSATVDLIAQHKDSQNISDYIETVENDESNVTIYVVGTLCGGSCSGMVQDLGYLLRDNYPATTRILISTVPTAQEANTQAAQQIAANAFGALRELDFIYHRFDADDAWEYVLADGNSKAHANADPYRLVYLLSTSNGQTSLKHAGLGQMIAMNLFLDTVAGGRVNKDAAIVDFGTKLSERQPNAEGHINWFFSFGLSVVWYPKSKITGLASCRIAERLLSSWLDEKETSIDEIKNDVAKDIDDIRQRIEKILYEGVNQTLKEMEEQAANLVVELDRPLSSLVSDSLYKTLINQLAQSFDKLREARNSISVRLRELALARLYEHYQNVPKFNKYFAELRKTVDAIIADLPTEDGQFPPNLDALDVVVELDKSCEKEPVLFASGLKRQARIFHREKYYLKVIEYWREQLAIRNDFLLSTLLRLLRVGESDRNMAEKYIPTATSVFNDIHRDITRECNLIGEVRRANNAQVERFKQLGNIEVIKELYVTGGLTGDIDANEHAISDGNTSPDAATVAFHILNLNSAQVTSARDFWLTQSPQEIAGTIINHYQVKGLDLLQDPVERVDNATLIKLADHASPYLEVDTAFNTVSNFRPPTFTYANKMADDIKELASTVGFSDDDNQCRRIELKNMIFFYEEKRAFPVNMINSYKTCQNHAQGHHHCTHKNPRFYDFARIERETEAEMFLLVAKKFVKEQVLVSRGDNDSHNVYEYQNQSGKLDYFKVNTKRDFRALSMHKDAFKFLKSKVNRAIQKIAKAKYVEQYKEIQNSYYNAIYKAENEEDDSAKANMQRQLDLINKYHETFIEKRKKVDTTEFA